MTPTTPPASTEKPLRHPILDVTKPHPIKLTHAGSPGGLVSTLTFRRNPAELMRRARDELNGLIELNVLLSAPELPEVVAFRDLRNRAGSIDAEIAPIELDLREANVAWDRARLELTGEKLAATLTKIDTKRQALVKRISDAKAGKALFEKDVLGARELAAKAVTKHFEKQMLSIHTEVQKQLFETAAALEAAITIFHLLDDAAAAWQLANLEMQSRIDETGIERLVNGVLDPPATPPAEQRP
jgi:hypothetical protein